MCIRAWLVISFVACGLFGCSGRPAWTEAGSGAWSTDGDVSLSITSARLGKVRTGGMHGPALSDKDVLIITTRFRNDSDQEVQYNPLQGGSFMMGQAGGIGGKLKDQAGKQYKAMVPSGFTSLRDRAAASFSGTCQAPIIERSSGTHARLRHFHPPVRL